MRVLNEKDEPIVVSACDLEHGYIREETVIRPDAAPIDNVTKFAWADEDYETIQRYVKIPEPEWRESRLAELKAALAETDYAVVKIAEGAATAEEYAELIAQRQTWREEINRLEVVQDG